MARVIEAAMIGEKIVRTGSQSDKASATSQSPLGRMTALSPTTATSRRERQM